LALLLANSRQLPFPASAAERSAAKTTILYRFQGRRQPSLRFFLDLLALPSSDSELTACEAAQPLIRRLLCCV